MATIKHVYNDKSFVSDSSGNIGIGTVTPLSKLHIKGGNLDLSQTGGDGNKILLTTDTAAHYIQANGYFVDIIGNANEVFRVFGGTNGASEYLRVKGDGVIQFNSYGVGTLVTDANGNISASSGGGAGGPFLPLAGNTIATAISSDVYMDDNTGIYWEDPTNGYASIALGSNFIITTGKANADLVLSCPLNDIQIIAAGNILISDYITHLGDLDTKFGFTAANQFQVIAGGNTNLNVQGNGVDLYYAGSVRLTTQTGGVAITGDLTVTEKVGIGNTQPGNELEVTGIIEATVGSTGGFAYGANPSSGQGLRIAVSNIGGDAFSGAARIENTSTASNTGAVLILRQGNTSQFSTITQYRIGTSNSGQGALVGFVRLTATNTIFSTSSSDERLKKDITNWTDDTLDKFKALQPKKFRYKIQDNSEEKTLGFIAQNEVANFPEAYVLNKENEEDDAMYSFNPMGMTTHLMKAIKDLVEKVEILENKITQLEK